MDESEQASTKDVPIKNIASKSETSTTKQSAESEISAVTSKDSSSSLTDPTSESKETKLTSTSSTSTDPPRKQSGRKLSKMHVKKSEDVSGKAHESSSPTKPPPKPLETRRRSSSGHSAKGDAKGMDNTLTGASSAPSVPQDDAGSADGMDVMAKMKMAMSKGAAPGMPKGAMPDLMSMMGKAGGAEGGGMMEMMMKSGGMKGMMAMMAKGGGMPDMMSMMAKGGGKPDMMGKGGGMPDMMAMMAKGGGMPDMMSMMVKGGGMPDMMSMMAKGGGMPDMMAMMAKGGGKPDMKSMMGKGKGSHPSPMGMANLFDCIIEVALANHESDVSDDDDESTTIEIPCKYCPRFFPCQMKLKTHILLAHEHEDTSVLNIKKLAIDGKGKRGMKDHHGARRKQSRDYDKSSAVEAADNNTKLSDLNAVAKDSSSQENVFVDSVSSRGLKRGRSKGSEAEETSGAAGVEETSPNADHSLRSTAHEGSGAEPSSSATGSAQELRKRKIRMRSQRSDSGDSSLQVTIKKKSKGGERKPETESSSRMEELPSGDLHSAAAGGETVQDDKPQSSHKESARQNKSKTSVVINDPGLPEAPSSASQRGKRTLQKNKDLASSDTETGADVSPGDSTSRGGGRKGRQSGAVAGASSTTSLTQRDQSPSTTRRSLRSRKSY
ncbi:serine-rich adhesin for platelets-like [Littorina saxatilis]|uniref:C2H2-type domain-containing protein n=1 Tax=Littorina saxatilis TaxID=31220 RepID=A0AAN9BFF4_9CAEN